MAAEERPLSAVRRTPSLAGHFWTVGPRLLAMIDPPRPAPARAWAGEVRDPEVGAVRLSGLLSEAASERLLVVVHGLGGSAASPYAVRAAATAHAAGLDCLRLNLRGADGRGEDFYHAGLTADLHAALASPELERYRSIDVLGFSLGGHLALRYATEAGDARLAAVAAVCAPLDLDRCAHAFDRPALWLYRGYILARLKRLWATLAERRPQTLAAERVGAIRRLREWDDVVVAPRHGFSSAGEYYSRASVAPVLDRLRVPALLAAAEHDPMVPATALLPVLRQRPERLEVRWLRRGGHVGLPADLDLGQPGELGLESQVLTWFADAASRTATAASA